MHDAGHDDNLHNRSNRRTERESAHTKRRPDENHVQRKVECHHPDADFHRSHAIAQCIERARGKLLHGVRPNGGRVHGQNEADFLHIIVTKLAALEDGSRKRLAH